MSAKPSLHYEAEYEQAKEELKSSAASISTTSTALEPPPYDDDGISFKPGRSFFIDAQGMKLIRFPVPSSQLEIPVNNSDGSLAYTSTREKRSSGDAVLSSPKLGPVVSTTYFFGPNRNPIIRLLQSPSPEPQELTITGKWTSRVQNFQTPDGSEFEWRYVRERGASDSKLLVLEKKGNTSSIAKRIAQLVRNEHTRPQGTGKTTAGNGGELVVHQDAYLEIDEALIIATCLLMLKKEMDRRRLIQIMVLTGGAGGGGD